MQCRIIYFLVCLWPLISISQRDYKLPHEITDDAVRRPMYFKNLTREDGLPSNEVRCAINDHLGYVWLATDNGLVRYDGSEMELFQYQPGDSLSLVESTITALLESKDSNIWIGTKNGLSLYNPQTQHFRNFKNDPDDSATFPCKWILCFYEDNNGTIWTGTNQGLVKVSTDPVHFQHINLKKNDLPFHRENLFRWVNNISVNPIETDQLILATRGGILMFDKKREEVVGDLEANVNHLSRSSALYIHQNKIWTGAWDTGLKKYNLEDGEWSVYNPDNMSNLNILSIKKWKKDQLAIGTVGHGIGLFNKTTHKFRFIEHDQTEPKSLLSNWIHTIDLIDQKMWVCSNRGISISDTNYHSFIMYQPELQLDFINSFLHDTATHQFFLLGSGCDGLYIWNTQKTSWSTIKYANPLRKERFDLYNALRDDAGNLWLLSSEGILIYDQENQRLVKYEDHEGISPSVTDTVLYTIFHDSRDMIWVGTRLDGIIRIDTKTGNFNHFPQIPLKSGEFLQSQDFRAISEDNKGRVWFGHYHGVFWYDPRDGTFSKSIMDSLAIKGFTSGVIWGISTDTLGRVYLSMDDQGLMRITEDDRGNYHFQLFHLAHGLNDLNLFSMKRDPQGNIWIINEGITRFNPYAETFEVFDTRNGLHQNKNWQNNLYIDDYGNIFLDDMKMYETANISEISVRPAIRNLLIENIEINSRITEKAMKSLKTGELVLEPGQQNILFTFKAICFEDVDQIKYRYKLDGYDTGWQYSGTKNSARYTNLLPGRYRFSVTASHRGVWLPYEITLQISLQPYFWQTTWFYFITLIIAALILFILYKIRVRQIRGKDRMKAEFRQKLAESEMQALRAQMNPHFIFNSLNSINNYILKNETEAASDFLTKFSRLVRQVLNNSREKMVPLSEDLIALKLYIELEQLRFDHSFEFDIQIDSAVEADRVLVPPLLIQPYVENSIWHGLMHKEGPGKVIIKAAIVDDAIVFEIEDDGIGREETRKYQSEFGKKKPSMGMHITKERIGLINKMYKMEADYRIEDLYHPDKTPAGTRVKIRIPIISN